MFHPPTRPCSTFVLFPGPGVVLCAEAPEIKRWARGTKAASAGGWGGMRRGSAGGRGARLGRTAGPSAEAACSALRGHRPETQPEAWPSPGADAILFFLGGLSAGDRRNRWTELLVLTPCELEKKKVGTREGCGRHIPELFSDRSVSAHASSGPGFASSWSLT